MNSKEMARRWGINLARLKRWSREFLPPDPKAGQRMGLAREYTLAEGYDLFFCGSLVSELGFSIPEARTILNDLRSFLTTIRAYPGITGGYIGFYGWRVCIRPTWKPGQFTYAPYLPHPSGEDHHEESMLWFMALHVPDSQDGVEPFGLERSFRPLAVYEEFRHLIGPDLLEAKGPYIRSVRAPHRISRTISRKGGARVPPQS